jgi:hypothetical protein
MAAKQKPEEPMAAATALQKTATVQQDAAI